MALYLLGYLAVSFPLLCKNPNTTEATRQWQGLIQSVNKVFPNDVSRCRVFSIVVRRYIVSDKDC